MNSIDPSSPPHPDPYITEVAVNDHDFSPPRGNPFPVVGVGASAGGLEAFGQLLTALPPDTGMAFVFIQHLDPQHASQLAELLDPLTTMSVETAQDDLVLKPNVVYVIPPNSSIVLKGERLRLVPREPGLHLPVDIFFRSLAAVQGSRAIGVILSGNASDGSMGLQAIKAECGITFVQQESTARFTGMPCNAILTGAADFILAPRDIGLELAQLGHHPYLIPRESNVASSETLPEGDREMQRVFALLKGATKVDFSHYKPTTMRRRIGRRMMVLRMDSLVQYARHTEANPSELRELYRDLLISVTSFFRDPAMFAALQRHLREDLANKKESNRPIRVWVPGCATGEEVYSLAICVHELMEELGLQRQVQFFGTDISEAALDRARQGLYSETIAQDLTSDRLMRHFHKVDGKYQIAKSIRENCIFARHDVTRDPPFSNLDLISCRNLLIYLDLPLQRRVTPIFHYALDQNGLLMLGTAETVGSAEDLFASVDKQVQIYRRKDVPVRLPFAMKLSAPPSELSVRELRPAPLRTGQELHNKVDRLIQHKYSPDAVLVDAGLQVLQFRGRVHPYLSAALNDSASNLLRIAPESLILPLRRVMDAVMEKNVSAREPATLCGLDGTEQDLWLEVTPLSGHLSSERYFLIVFTQRGPFHDGATARTSYPSSAEETIHRLEVELAETRENLRNLTEDYEAHGEELQAVNEEARSANEELQSTNEELSTTKEELQSANEELTTVNEELQSRNHELSAINSDLQNLLNAVSLAVVMVDNELRVRRFNPSAEKLLSLSSTDLGRPVGNLRAGIETPWLEIQIRTVINTLETLSREAQDISGHWYSVVIRPYRTVDNRIVGAVITMQDVDALKRGLEAAEEARNYAEGMIETVREPLIVLDADLRVQRATTAFYETFLVSREETEGRLLYDLGSGQWNNARLRELLGAALFRQEPFHDFELEYDFPHIGRRVMRLNARRIPRLDPKHRVLLLSIEDTTERREEAQTRYQRLFESAKDGIVVIDRETETIVDVNPYFLQLTGYGREEIAGKRLCEAAPFMDLGELCKPVPRLSKQDLLRLDDVELVGKKGERLSVDIVANGYLVGSQPVVQLNLRDISARKAAAAELRLSQERFRNFVDSVKDYALFELDRGGAIVNWTSGAERLLGWSEAEALGKNSEIVFTPEDVESGRPREELTTARREGRALDERWHIRKNGSRFFASGVLTQVCDEHGLLRGFAKVMRDDTARKAAEERLKQQAALLDLAHDAIVVRRLDGTILSWNRGAENLYGWKAAEVLGKSLHQLLQTEAPEPLELINAYLLKQEHWNGVVSHLQRDGTRMVIASRWALQQMDVGEPRVLEINGDITAQVEQEQRLQRSVEEKSTLVREIHHRVKNNLQVIVSLLSLQSNQMKDPRLQEAFEETESRVRAIAQIHERLYASEDLTEIEFAGYLTYLSRELVALYTTGEHTADLQLQVEEMVLHIEQAIPLGLIANELIINSLKHGLKSGPGTLAISLKYMPEMTNLQPGQTLDEGWAELCIKDSGPGIPQDLDFKQLNSLGYRLIKLLVRQVRGDVKLQRSPGTTVRVFFPLSVHNASAES